MRLASRWTRYGAVLLLAVLFVSGVSRGFHWRHEPFFFAGVAILCAGCFALHKLARSVWLSGFSLAAGFLIGGVGAGTLTANAYAMNYRGFFYLSLLLWLDLLLLAGLKYRPGALGKLVLHTVVLTVVLLPAADLITRPRRETDRAPLAKRPYAYETARRDPVAFQRWWERYTREWQNAARDTQMPDPQRRLPFRLKPNSRGKLFESEVRINRLGFRGGEFSREKNGMFRIVALGESTTMGCTLEATDTPWPAVLEIIIADRLRPARPVQVINAGVQAYSLAENLLRLADDILPLKPDLIVSYHGYNGFMYINIGLPPVRSPQPPRFIDRPLYLLARTEFHLRWLIYLWRHPQPTAVPPLPAPWRDAVLESPLARKYEELIAIAKTNGIRLALADFNLAVGAHGDPDVIEYYRSVFPQVREIIPANDANTWLLGQLARRHPEVLYVPTQTNLHGIHSKFIDLVHLTQQGRWQLAQNIFEGIRGVIPQDPPDSAETRRELGGRP